MAHRALVLLAVGWLAGCGGARSFWLATPETASADRGCWDACHQRWNPDTAELAKCVAACPGVERRDGGCPAADRARCVGDNRSAVTLILIAGVVGLAAILAAALLL